MTKLELAKRHLKDAEYSVRECEAAIRKSEEAIKRSSPEDSRVYHSAIAQYKEWIELAKMECEMYRDLIVKYGGSTS